jgi:flagellar protein FlaG
VIKVPIEEITNNFSIDPVKNVTVSQRSTVTILKTEQNIDKELSTLKSAYESEENRSIHDLKLDKKKDANQSKIGEEVFNKAIEELNKNLNMFNSRLSFLYNDDQKLAVIQIMDRKTGEVIKQMPPEEMLKSLSKISNIVGILIDKMI